MEYEKQICVIGCGIAGLCALRVFSEPINEHPINYCITAYERADKLGGLWNYCEDTDSEFNFPIYRDLKTNLPKELMELPDFPFPDELFDSFISHLDVLQYINNYTKHYELEKFIQYNSEVTNVDPVTIDNSVKWKITVRNSKLLITDEKYFDVVLVCNGHFDIPNLPIIPGIENFKGEFFHSKYYKIPEKYNMKTVFIVGARSSGMDIAIQLINVAKKVYLSHSRNRVKWDFNKEKFEETYTISHIDSMGVICLNDGSKYEADTIIFCTGYKINLTFLNDSIGLKYDNLWVRPLYKHIINPYFPSTFFMIGLGYEIPVFIHCYMQSKVARAIVQNCHKNVNLTSENLLDQIIMDQKNFELNNIEMKYRHFFNEEEWPYLKWCAMVSKEVMTFKIPTYIQDMFELVRKWRYKNADQYKNIVLKLAENSKLGFVIKYGPENDFYSDDFEILLYNEKI